MARVSFGNDMHAAEASTDYHTTIRVKASPATLFEAITTTNGLTAWWVPHVTGSGETGGDLKFFMSAPQPLVVHVDEATPASVRWMVADCPFLPDWVGTRPTFTITPVEGGLSELDFCHQGLNSELDCIDMCTRSWDHFIRKSLRDYVESGHGSPMGSEADTAWRRAWQADKAGTPIVIFGNHSSVLVPMKDRERIRRFYCDILGGRIMKADPERDFVRLGENFFIGFLYGDVTDETEFLRSFRAIWLEIKSDNVEEISRKIIESGLVRTLNEIPDPHLYFQAPGGQVLRLVGIDEDLSFYEGAGAGPDVAKVKQAIAKEAMRS